ncbi:LysR family transcriptional regulator [Sphingomonas sp. MMSM20]|uniref:LysR family transcriptional regulator n=1 Tax=Sphingomonas lycopersici TaxID=2951807 RepID=UPI002238583A|nr:LysR family transcriptional regulator [Sphingomonas lycopersici]MCW6531912.1 LysR family transcriptional regulator [Sphingomonas lycopersici]
MMKLDGVTVFVAVAEAGSISEAARRIGLAKSVVSERLAELERVLGAKLVQRTTRKLALTEDGFAFLGHARTILREVEEATAQLSERRGSLSGPLRIAGPVGFGVAHLGRALSAFLAAHPGIDLSLDLDDRFVDVAADGYDAVIRHGAIRDNRLIARRLCATRRVLVAAPGYLAAHGAPRSLDELEQASAVHYTNRNSDWRFSAADGARVIRPRAKLRVNNGLVMRDAVLAGIGIAMLPSFFVHDELVDGRLVRIDIGVEPEGAELYIAYPPNRSASAKLTALIEWLRRSFGDPPYWEAGLPRAGGEKILI